MTLPNKASRKITIDSKKFRYFVDGDDGFIRFISELEGKGNKQFSASFDYIVSKELLNILKNIDYRENEDFIITPKVVREIIIFGMSNGWNPSEKGGTEGYDLKKIVNFKVDENDIKVLD